MQKANELLPAAGGVAQVIFPALPELPVWIYRPPELKRTDRIIVAVHGISRDGREQAEASRKIADQLGCWVLAPVFQREAYPRYQQLGKGGIYPRADLALTTLLTLWKGLQGEPWLKVWLTGYSGGAQFVHRYALHYPQQIAGLVVSSAGWYSFPDVGLGYPYGIAETVSLQEPDLEQMLALPMLITIGEADTERDSSLRTGKRIDLQQGNNRFERAISWGKAVRTLQREMGLRPAEVRILSGQGHSYINNMQQGNLTQIVLTFLQQLEGNSDE